MIDVPRKLALPSHVQVWLPPIRSPLRSLRRPNWPSSKSGRRWRTRCRLHRPSAGRSDHPACSRRSRLSHPRGWLRCVVLSWIVAPAAGAFNSSVTGRSNPPVTSPHRCLPPWPSSGPVHRRGSTPADWRPLPGWRPANGWAPRPRWCRDPSQPPRLESLAEDVSQILPAVLAPANCMSESSTIVTAADDVKVRLPKLVMSAAWSPNVIALLPAFSVARPATSIAAPSASVIGPLRSATGSPPTRRPARSRCPR